MRGLLIATRRPSMVRNRLFSGPILISIDVVMVMGSASVL